MRFAGIFASCRQFLSFSGGGREREEAPPRPSLRGEGGVFRETERPGYWESGREKEELRNFRENMQIYLHVWKKSCIFAGESSGESRKKTNQI